MSFDKPTRNRLQGLVASCRRALQADIEDQLQGRYGMYRAGERIQPLEQLSALSFEDQDIAAQLRDLFGHYRAQEPNFTAAYDRLVHEIGFTLLNRLVALRLAEERGYVVECVRKALDSEGFRIYQLIVEDQLGTPFETYRFFLHLIFDEMAVDLHFLFDRSLPQGLVFPSEAVLRKVLADLSASDLMPLWKEDETIGWVYQFFNDPEDRQRMRAESNAPRNSREMAVRNQFFTPRYVVEFLVDNTLGRTWIEMRQGKTELRERCRYLLKRTDEVFLAARDDQPLLEVTRHLKEGTEETFTPFERGVEDGRLEALAHTVDAYGRSFKWGDGAWEEFMSQYPGIEEAQDFARWTTQELLDYLFVRCRNHRGTGGYNPFWEDTPAAVLVANEIRRRALESRRPDATKEELLAAPFFVDYRAQKDPRDLKILDPACGSGHFLLYSYDLLAEIYREAWIEHLEAAPKSVGTGKTLREDFGSLEELERAVPGLILANNLFGVDIDPRAAQIAAVALWLRAQSAYQEVGLRNMADRPQITKMNFVVAEPMPGEADLKQEFLDGLRPRLVAHVAERVFEVMKFAGEAGVLLRVEQALSETLSAACKQWEAEREVPDGLFPELARARTKSLFDVSDIDDDAFWEIAEETILAALSRFAETAEARDPLRRRLFADDSARGFAFIDLCRTRFDAFLMNPPFGEPTSSTKPMMESEYQDAKSDVLQAFVERGGEMLVAGGLLGCISSRTPFFLGGSQDFRERVVLRLFSPVVFADLGLGVMDSAMVEAAAYALRTLTQTEREQLVQHLAIDADGLAKEKGGAFRRSHWEALRGLKRTQAEQELGWLVEAGYVQREEGRTHAPNIVLCSRTTKPVPLRSKSLGSTVPIPCFRAIGISEKADVLLGRLVGKQSRFFVSVRSLREIPGVPFAYWVPEGARAVWSELSSLNDTYADIEYGASTKDSFRFTRCWWEVDARRQARTRQETTQGRRWVPYVQGGGHEPFARAFDLVLDWQDDGKLLKHVISVYRGERGWGYNWSASLNGHARYFDPGFSWARRTQLFAPHVVPAGCISSVSRYIGYSRGVEVLPLLAFLNSRVVCGLLRMLTDNQDSPNYIVGIVQRLPVPNLDQRSLEKLNNLAERLFDNRISVLRCSETSHFFSGMDPREALEWSNEFCACDQGLSRDLNDVATMLYGFSEEGLQVPAPPGSQTLTRGISMSSADDLLVDAAELEEDVPAADVRATCSWLFGLAIGRFDINVSLHPVSKPRQENPLAPLPVFSPGMLQPLDGSPETNAYSNYPVEIPLDGILVDDPGKEAGDEHPADLVARIRRALSVIHSHRAGETEIELCQGLEQQSLRDYLRKPAGFFADHLKRYSKSRRKAPIYWPLTTASNSYTMWLYYPLLTEQTLYTAVESYLRPKLVSVERLRDALESQLRDYPLAHAKDRDRLDQLRTFAQELIGLRDELLRVAALPYKPDLDDGVVINAAPLRKLFRYKPWVKELDEVWKKLEKGEYDWSRMALHLWPDRVSAKCVTDRSLAIAHDLESICTAPDRTKNGDEKRGRKKKEAALIEEEEA